jgi:hypothetical protein
MQFQIQILSATVESKPTANGGYKVNEVAYKDLKDNKVAGKKIMSFGQTAEVFKALENAQAGEVYTITQEKLPGKDGKEYWTWLQAEKGAAGSTPVATTSAPPTAPTQVSKGNYETAEERAKKQVYIVRQSSISNAIDTLSVGSKSVNPEQVIEVAEKYFNYVINGKEVPKPTGTEALAAMEDDIPY